MDAKEDIRAQLNIEDVVGAYVELKRAGRNFKGLSPFSQERTPSFVVSPEKHIWHDFSSGKGGDVFAFIMEIEGVDFKAAMEMLARKAGIDLSLYQTKGDGGLSKKKDRLFEAARLAARYYQESLKTGSHAIDYIKKRGFNKQVVGDFLIGYSPAAENALTNFLTKRGFSPKELQDAGLSVNRRGRLGDMFRDRLMVTLADPQGRPIGFTARILNDNPKAPKYINTPQTLIYDKSRHVFGLHLAKDAIRTNDFAVLVEGNLDVVSSHQVNIKNVVATAGTALTESHLRSISRFTTDVRLAFDADKAGVNATQRAISVASNIGVDLSIVRLPGDFKDPDELIKKDAGLWQQAIDNPVDAVDWLMDHYDKMFDLKTAEGKRRITDQALNVVRGIGDPVVQEHYVGKISARVGVSVEALLKKLNSKLVQQKPVLKKRDIVEQKASASDVSLDHLLALNIVYPQLRDSLLNLEPGDFITETRQVIFNLIKNAGAGKLKDLSSDDIAVKISELELIVEDKYPIMSDQLHFVAASIAKKILKAKKTSQRALLAKAFAGATDPDEQQAISQKIKKLDQEIESLKR